MMDRHLEPIHCFLLNCLLTVPLEDSLELILGGDDNET